MSRVTELERTTNKGTTRERELVTRVDELTRAVVRNQGNGRDRVKEISESKAVAGMSILGNDRAVYKEWHTQFVNVMSQLRPGIRPILKSIEMHRDESWTEQDFDVANDDDKCREMF